ncbi:hypothetical protein EPZ47_02575 [Pseudomonas viciae]|uniref:Nucleoid-structuring protein H-NS n=1 Tax=Pseudomonas viciae TaxID=2505979 RepID=A0A4P7PB77_9PSED|nr:hypothetical protein EPZ47_02575 [Pseudomonas viciae]
MAQRGYPGIHAGMPTPQCLRSAIVVNGALRSTSTPPRGGLTADQGLWEWSDTPPGCIRFFRRALAVAGWEGLSLTFFRR